MMSIIAPILIPIALVLIHVPSVPKDGKELIVESITVMMSIVAQVVLMEVVLDPMNVNAVMDGLPTIVVSLLALESILQILLCVLIIKADVLR